MPSRKIILEENYAYHIYNRWFEKQIIFKNDNDFERFYKTIVRYNKIYTWIKLLSYSFLPNHFHFILKSTKSWIEISDFMRKVQQSYAMYLNKNISPDLKKRWPVFEWRFKAKIIDNDDYLNQCIAYVNLNPLKHEIVDNIDNYKWTSYHQIDKSKIEKYKDFVLDELEI